MAGNSLWKETIDQSAVIHIAKFKKLTAGLRFVQFNEHLTAIGRWNEEKIDPRTIRTSPGFRIDRSNFKFFLQDLRGSVNIGATIFHLLDAFSKLGQVLCDGSGAAGLARRQNVQGNAASELKFEFLGILIRRYVGESWSAVGNSNMPKRIAVHRESNRNRGIGSVQQCGEFALCPPCSDCGPSGRPAQTVDFTRGREPFGFFRRSEVRDG